MDTKWLNRVPDVVLRDVLVEYRYLVRRFPQWIALTIGRSEDNEIRQLLMPNLVEECGSQNRPSHLEMLDRCLTSCGIVLDRQREPFKTTKAIEAWFYSIFATESTLASLCVLGPGTEAISQEFLIPLETGLRNAFRTVDVDFSYFEAHRTTLEEQHAKNIQAAMTRLENLENQSAAERDTWIRAAIDAHADFWTFLKVQLINRQEISNYFAYQQENFGTATDNHTAELRPYQLESQSLIHTSRR